MDRGGPRGHRLGASSQDHMPTSLRRHASGFATRNLCFSQVKILRNVCCQVLELRTRVLGADHPDTALAICELGKCLDRGGGAPGEAEGLLRQALELLRRGPGADHPYTMDTTNALGRCLSHQGNQEAAESLLRSALDLRTRVFGVQHPDVAESLHDLGCCLARQQQKLPEAHTMLRRAVDMRTQLVGADHPSTLETWNALGPLRRAESPVLGVA